MRKLALKIARILSGVATFMLFVAVFLPTRPRQRRRQARRQRRQPQWSCSHCGTPNLGVTLEHECSICMGPMWWGQR